jgi:hypothetical protein
MTKDQVIKRLCGLITIVGGEEFGHELIHDCICGKNPIPKDNPKVDEKIINFIEDCVMEKLHG